MSNNDFNSINDAIKSKNSIINQKWKAYKEYEILKELETNINKWLYENCQHEWIKDDFYVGPYDKPSYICKICKSTK